VLLSKILEEARELTTPTLEQYKRVEKVAEEVVGKIRTCAQHSPFNPEVVTGGSYARDTWLPEKADIDIFLRYPLGASKIDFEEDSYKISCEAFGKGNLIIRYAEHPYVETYVNDARVNIVPCYKVESGNWLTAADRSPYHLGFMQANLSKKQRSDVRLLKKFMKTSESYGAEIKIGGFSGYMSEVLIYRYETFENLVMNAQKWRLPLVITDDDKVEYVKERFFRDKIIITDPVDINRNLGRALYISTISRFILESRSFLKKPSVEFFKEKKKKVTKKRLSLPLANNLLAVVFEHEIMNVDILWGMLNHTLISLAKHFEKYDFEVIRSVAASDEQKTSAFIFLFQTMTISSYHIRSGPSIFDDNNLQNFLLKNRNNTELLWINDEGKILALKDRPIMSTTSLLQKILKDPQKFGVSKKIIQALKRKNKIYVGKEILSDKRKWLLVGVEEVFEPKGKNYFY
jgi:tRNA nucleotidyltransferase (CCA-adding enzyme)